MADGAVLEGNVPTGKPAGVKSYQNGFFFDTVIMVTLYDADDTLMEDIWAMCNRYENLLSKTVEGSDIWRINHANGETITVDPETWNILKEAKAINELTNGAFSITIAPVVALWDFTGGTMRTPTAEELAENLPLVDDSRLVLGENYTVTLPAGMSIDLGGIAKGFISDRIADLVRDRSSGTLISLGGNMYVTGTKPDGSLWCIGIQDPDSTTGMPLAACYVDEGTLVTSGVYQRCFEKDGVFYHHILDPETGISVRSDLVSATIVTDCSMEADALATACIVLGSDQAMELLASLGLDGFLIKTDGAILTTQGFDAKYNTVYAK